LGEGCLNSVYVRGEAYLAAGQGAPAAAEFQKILDHSGIVQNCWTGALARLGVARANGLQARTSQGADADAARVRALAAYKSFLTLWKDADPDISVLKQAKAEYAKLLSPKLRPSCPEPKDCLPLSSHQPAARSGPQHSTVTTASSS
jgi:hypothetical protein